MLFVCRNAHCLTVDNTAIAPGYWTNNQQCTACTTGVWHGRFERRKYDPATDGEMNVFRNIRFESVPAL